MNRIVRVAILLMMVINCSAFTPISSKLSTEQFNRINIAFGNKYYMTPNGAGKKNGRNWENALSSLQKIKLDALIKKGDVLYLGGGVYDIQHLKISLKSSGSSKAYKSIIGVDNNGLGYPILMGKLTASGYGSGRAVKIKANASFWYIANLQIIRVKRGINIGDGRNRNLIFNNISISLSRHPIYIGNNLKNFQFKNITMERYSKQGLRCQGGCVGESSGKYSIIEGLIADHTGADFREYQRQGIGMQCRNNCVNFAEHIDKINRDFGTDIRTDLRLDEWNRHSASNETRDISAVGNEYLGCPDGCNIFREPIPFGFIFYHHGDPSQYIKLKNSVAMNHKYPRRIDSESTYWNGDGFVIEDDSGNHSFVFENTIAFNNYDGGYDDKGIDSKYKNTVSFKNKRNYRSWNGAEYQNCFSGYAGTVEDPFNGDGWWAGSKVNAGAIKISNCTALDNRHKIFSEGNIKTFRVTNSILARTNQDYANPVESTENAEISLNTIRYSGRGKNNPQFKQASQDWQPIISPTAHNALAFPSKGYQASGLLR